MSIVFKNNIPTATKYCSTVSWLIPTRERKGIENVGRFTLREIFCIQGRNTHWVAYYMFYSSVCSVYRHQSVYAEAEGKVHFSGCFLKGFCFLVLSNWLPRGARENLDFEFESSWFCAERLESLPLEASATTGVRSWPWSPKVVVFFYFFLVFLWLHIKGKDELDLTVKTDRDEKGRHHLAGGVEGGRPSSIPPPQKHTWGWAASQSYLSHLPQHQRPPAPGAAPTATWAVHAAVSSSPKVCGCGTLLDRLPPPARGL